MKENENNNQKGYINKYLIDAFKSLNKSQAEIIRELKKSQPYVSALMNGKKQVGKEVAKQLSTLYSFDEGLILTNGISEKEKLSEVEITKSENSSDVKISQEELDFNEMKLEDKLNHIFKQNLHLRDSNEDLKEKIEDLTLIFEISMAPILRHFKLNKDDEDQGNNLHKNASN